MAGAFEIVVFVVVGLAVVIGLLTLRGRGGSYDGIGAGAFALSDERDGEGGAAPEDAEAELRQLVAARNLRRERRGEAPLDVAAELAALTGGDGAAGSGAAAVDPELRAEVRALVEARNERRLRAGRAPLDVEAEVARELRLLGGG